jgi:hypothetical protein
MAENEIVKLPMETGIRQGSTSTSSRFVSSTKDPIAQLGSEQLVATELVWAYHSPICSVELSKVTFPDSQFGTQMFCGQTKGGNLMTDVLAPVLGCHNKA